MEFIFISSLLFFSFYLCLLLFLIIGMHVKLSISIFVLYDLFDCVFFLRGSLDFYSVKVYVKLESQHVSTTFYYKYYL